MPQQLEARERLLEEMVAREVTAEELARLTKLSLATVYRVLRGERCFPATATKIARALGKRASDLGLL